MACPQIDKAFRMAEQQISDDIVKLRMNMANNAYWGRIPDRGKFPIKSGTRMKKIRLSRVGYDSGNFGWRPVVDNDCFSNVCSTPPADTINHGSSESFYSLETFKVSSNPVCLSLLPFRQMGEEELLHLEDGVKQIAKQVWNEWGRTRYVGMSEHKWVALVSDAALGVDGNTCNTLEAQCQPQVEDNQGFIFWNRSASNLPIIDAAFPIDERYVSVKINPSKINNISELSGDILEAAGIELLRDQDNMPFLNQGVPLLDVVVPDFKIMRRLIQLERMQESECLPQVMYDGKSLSLALGVRKVIRDSFGIRWDDSGMKFYPDVAYNATLSAYDPNSPTTWPRFVRVYPYVAGKNPNGTINYIYNKYYMSAPFGISTIFTPQVMGMRSHPMPQSIGTAKINEGFHGYSGEVKWFNKYDKVCNPEEDIGHWDIHFGAGAEPIRPEYGHAFFHRISHIIQLSAVRCTPAMLGCQGEGFTTDCYNSVQAGETITTSSRGANTTAPANNDRWAY